MGMGKRNEYFFIEFIFTYLAKWGAVGIVANGYVFPADMGVVADRLDDRLFSGKARREMLHGIFMFFGVIDFLFIKYVRYKRIAPTLDRFLDPLNFNDIYAGAVNHGWAIATILFISVTA